MNEIQLVLKTDLAATLPEIIEFNYEELKGALAAELEKYKGLLVSEDQIRAAKDDRAKLNKLLKTLKDCKKSVKERLLKPLDDFAAKVDELCAMVKEPEEAIAKQLDEFEERRRGIKKEQIRTIYEQNIGDLAGVLPLGRIMEDRWLNATALLANVEKELKARIANVRTGLDSIGKVLVGDRARYRSEAERRFLATHDLAATLAEVEKMEAEDRALAERLAAARKAEEERKAAEEARRRAEEEARKAREAAAVPAPETVPAWPSGASEPPAGQMDAPEAPDAPTGPVEAAGAVSGKTPASAEEEFVEMPYLMRLHGTMADLTALLGEMARLRLPIQLRLAGPMPALRELSAQMKALRITYEKLPL